MDVLIKREDAIKAIDDVFDGIPMEQTYEILKVRKTIRELPSADTEIEIIKAEAFAKGIDSERKRISDWCRPSGEWTPCTKNGLPLTELGRREWQKWYGYKCSECNFIYKGNALIESPFCQNCGCRMKGADDE